jgi:hypothetical protein
MAESKKIAIIGAGIFGLAIAEKLQKLNYQIDIFEKNKNILSGASRNNLNRIHQGFHYPRSMTTINQSSANYKIFIKKFKFFVKNKQMSYYLIAKNGSKVSLDKYLKIIKNIPYFSEEVSTEQIPIKTSNILGGIITHEKIYDWQSMEKYFKNNLKDNINFLFNEYVHSINKNNTLTIKKQKKYIDTPKYQFIIDCSYSKQNNFKRNLGIPLKKKIFQKTLILELQFKNCPDIGAAVMDGKFVSFLPKGKSKNVFLLYDVSHSILKRKISFLYPKNFKNKISNKKIVSAKKKIIKKLNFFFPEIEIKKILNYRISDRVLDLSRNDQRLTNVKFWKNSVFFVNQGKTDHCIEVAENIYTKIKKFNVN